MFIKYPRESAVTRKKRTCLNNIIRFLNMRQNCDGNNNQWEDGQLDTEYRWVRKSCKKTSFIVLFFHYNWTMTINELNDCLYKEGKKILRNQNIGSLDSTWSSVGQWDDTEPFYTRARHFCPFRKDWKVNLRTEFAWRTVQIHFNWRKTKKWCGCILLPYSVSSRWVLARKNMSDGNSFMSA
jgi:hypothetical protein